jgi:hypothetical protein
MNLTPAHITIARTDAADVRQRQIIVSIDDGPKAQLLFGESVSWDVAPGPHVLKANNTLVWKKLRFSVDADERASFRVVNRTSRLTLGFLTLMGVAPLLLTVERVETPDSPAAPAGSAMNGA